MDVPEETRLRHKRDFIQFLDNMYMDEIKTLVQQKRHRLIVYITHIHDYFRDSSFRIQSLCFQDDKGNLLVTKYGLCKYKDHQILSIQEVPENVAPGQLPRSMDVISEDDLVDSCKPGDRVAIFGIYKALPGKTKGSVNGVFRCVFLHIPKFKMLLSP